MHSCATPNGSAHQEMEKVLLGSTVTSDGLSTVNDQVVFQELEALGLLGVHMLLVTLCQRAILPYFDSIICISGIQWFTNVLLLGLLK